MDTEQSVGMKRNIVIALAAIIILGGAYVFFAEPQTAEGDIVARVGDEVITQHDVDVRIRQTIVRGQSGLTVPEAALFDRSLDDLITESLVFQEALREGFEVDHAEVERRYENVRANYDSEEAFLERMRENLLTPDAFRENIGRQDVLFRYLEELKRRELQAEIEGSLGMGQADGPSVEITAETVPVTQEDINRLAGERAEELKKEVKIEVFVN